MNDWYFGDFKQPPPYNGRYSSPLDEQRQGNKEISWVVDANGNILEYLGDKRVGVYRVATEQEIKSSPRITIHESKEPCPFLLPGQHLIKT